MWNCSYSQPLVVIWNPTRQTAARVSKATALAANCFCLALAFFFGCWGDSASLLGRTPRASGLRWHLRHVEVGIFRGMGGRILLRFPLGERNGSRRARPFSAKRCSTPWTMFRKTSRCRGIFTNLPRIKHIHVRHLSSCSSECPTSCQTALGPRAATPRRRQGKKVGFPWKKWSTSWRQLGRRRISVRQPFDHHHHHHFSRGHSAQEQQNRFSRPWPFFRGRCLRITFFHGGTAIHTSFAALPAFFTAILRFFIAITRFHGHSLFSQPLPKRPATPGNMAKSFSRKSGRSKTGQLLAGSCWRSSP